MHLCRNGETQSILVLKLCSPGYLCKIILIIDHINYDLRNRLST